MSKPTDLLTPQEVATLLKLKSVRSVYKLAASHHWRFQRTISRRCVRYERGGLLDWLKRCPARCKLDPQVVERIKNTKAAKQSPLQAVPAQLHTCAEEGNP